MVAENTFAIVQIESRVLKEADILVLVAVSIISFVGIAGTVARLEKAIISKLMRCYRSKQAKESQPSVQYEDTQPLLAD